MARMSAWISEKNSKCAKHSYHSEDKTENVAERGNVEERDHSLGRRSGCKNVCLTDVFHLI